MWNCVKCFLVIQKYYINSKFFIKCPNPFFKLSSKLVRQYRLHLNTCCSCDWRLLPISKVQQISRCCANEFWLQLCNPIQVCADTGKLKGMYDGMKQAIQVLFYEPSWKRTVTGVIEMFWVWEINKFLRFIIDVQK